MTATLPPQTDVAVRKLPALLPRLSRQSVEKHFDAYVDVAWDDPELAISPRDPRCGLFEFDALAQSDWYRAQAPEVQAEIGLHRICGAFKVGMQFENLLQRGLLSYCFRLPNGAAEYRYLHHEIIEESQHSLMFQETINRTGLPVAGMPRWLRFAATAIVPVYARWVPEQFFVLVLGGEDPVDYLQRRQLREGTTHPLIERIMKIHVTEEARHIAFARTYLKDLVPELSPLRRHLLAVRTPLVLWLMASLMVDPTPDLHRHQGVPKSVLREARTSAQGRLLRRESVAKLRRLCRELGLMTAPAKAVWRWTGLYDDDDRAAARPDTVDDAA
ncbi:AurF N-oxygenase family protein [Aquihabitans sp. McL0605]|uniref:AurF N-oxygenase family protein n=1 Tax=Aquihabitans sp. McL0605 TaxID=3415671 RepID=UPI003CFB342A